MRLVAARAIIPRSNSSSRSPARTDVAFFHARLKTLAAEIHGIDADVHEDFGATRRAQRDSVVRGGHRNDLAVAGRMQRVPVGSIATPSPRMR